MWRFIVSFVFVASLARDSVAQSGDQSLSVALRGSYTTSSKVFYNPESPSPDIRSRYLALDNIYGGGLEIRFQDFADNYFIALSVELLSRFEDGRQVIAFGNPPRSLPISEGYRLVPIELGANMFIPLGSQRLRLAMGGGLGAYYARRIFAVANVDAQQVNNPVSFGIHVESSFDYRVLDGLAVRAEMRFRDPEVTTESKFQETKVDYDGSLVTFPQDAFKTKININGLSFSIGLAVDLF